MRLLSIYNSVNRWTIEEEERKIKSRSIIKENSGGNIEFNASS